MAVVGRRASVSVRGLVYYYFFYFFRILNGCGGRVLIEMGAGVCQKRLLRGVPNITFDYISAPQKLQQPRL